MSKVEEGLLFTAMRHVEEAQRDVEQFENVGPAEAASNLRRRLREVLDKAYTAGWQAGYSASALDEAAGRDAARQAARSAPDVSTAIAGDACVPVADMPKRDTDNAL